MQWRDAKYYFEVRVYCSMAASLLLYTLPLPQYYRSVDSLLHHFNSTPNCYLSTIQLLLLCVQLTTNMTTLLHLYYHYILCKYDLTTA